MSSFEVFCTEEALRQRREGFDVPTVAEPFAELQWRREAWRRWESLVGEGDCPEFVERVERGANAVIAAVEKCASSGDTHLVSHTFKQESELQTTLSSLELLLRLFFLDNKNTALLTAFDGLRRNAAELRSRGILGCERGKYPELYIVYEMFSLRKMLLHWENLELGVQMAAIETALSLVTLVKSPKYAELEKLLKMVQEDTSLVSANVLNIIASLDHACCDTPYAFPSLCRDVIAVVYPHDAGPLGKLSVELDVEREKEISGDDITTSDDDSLSHVIGVNRLSPKRSRHDHMGVQQARSCKFKPHATRDGEDCISCCSKYHAQYSTPEKHASKACRFCVVCHMMETLFNGYTGDCCWGHAPTKGKISFHLKHYPEVYASAMSRFANLTKGTALPPCDDVPLH